MEMNSYFDGLLASIEPDPNNVKLAKYISGSPSYATNTMTITINIASTPTPIPTTAPTDIPTPTKAPTLTRTPTPIPTEKAFSVFSRKNLLPSTTSKLSY